MKPKDAAAMLAVAALAGSSPLSGDYYTTSRQPGYYPKPPALGNLVTKRRAKNKAARKARAKNRK